MKCPVCGSEMERGKVVTELSRGLFFLPPDGKLGFFCTQQGIEKQGGVVLDGPYRSNLPNETEVPAALCRNCRRIVMEY